MCTHDFVLQSDCYGQMLVPEVDNFPKNVTRLFSSPVAKVN